MRVTSMKLAAAVLAGGIAVAGCGNSLQLGAAATTTQGRISSASLANEVTNLAAAYRADRSKGITPRHPAAQSPQEVLTWLLTFKIADRLAQQHGITVTPADVQSQLTTLASAAAQQKISSATYVSAAGAVPPDLLPQIGRYFAILQKLENRFDGGTTPTAQAGQAALQAQVSHAQCLAAKNRNIKVNPQFGAFDYGTYQVVTVPSKLSAPGGPS
ncbi:MAG: hypothetical protein ACRDNZ_00325, partial [Streptosporangiaceae bacterium]